MPGRSAAWAEEYREHSLGSNLSDTERVPCRICPLPSRSLILRAWLLVSSTGTYSASGPVPQGRPSPCGVGMDEGSPSSARHGDRHRSRPARPVRLRLKVHEHQPACALDQPIGAAQGTRGIHVLQTHPNRCAQLTTAKPVGTPCLAKARENSTLQPRRNALSPSAIRPRPIVRAGQQFASVRPRDRGSSASAVSACGGRAYRRCGLMRSTRRSC